MPLMRNGKHLSDADILALEEPFTSKTKRLSLSYSAHKILMSDPKLFHQEKILGERKIVKKKAYDEGSLRHLLLLEPKKFDDKYYIQKESKETLSDNIKSIIFDTSEFRKSLVDPADPTTVPSTDMKDWTQVMLQFMKDKDLFQKMKPDTQLAKLITPLGLEYWDMLINKSHLTAITQKQYDSAKSDVDDFKLKEQYACNIMGLGTVKGDAYMEVDWFLPRPYLPFDEHGILDNVFVHHDSKTVFLNDLKTSSSELNKFKYDIRKFGYDKQIPKYANIVQHWMNENGLTDYTLEVRVIVMAQHNYYGVLRISAETLSAYQHNHEIDLQKAKYHFDNWDFSKPYDFLQGKEVII